MPAIVVGVDFSEPSRKAFEAAARLAEDLDARLVMVHALEPIPAVGVRDPIGEAKAEVDAALWEQHAQAWVEKGRRRAEVEAVSRPGKPADVVLAVAAERKAIHIVVGSHGRTGIKRAVLGSVAEAIVRRSAVPVLVVPS
jgi:nucleotide-binding universal stress UspA family protein